MTRALATWILAATTACFGVSLAKAFASERLDDEDFDSEPTPKRMGKKAQLPPVSGYADFTFTAPIQYRKLALALPSGSEGELGVLAQRSLITTLEVDVPVSKHWRLVARPSSYNADVLDPILGIEYERTLRGGLNLAALEYFTLPISSFSRESGRVTTLGEALRLTYQRRQWAPYAQVDASYSWFSNALTAIQGNSERVRETERPVPVDQDTIAFGGGVQRYLHDDQWMLGASANFEHLHFHQPPLPALWSTSIAPLAVTYFPVEGMYVDASVLIIQQAKLIIWPDEPLFLFGGGIFF